MSLVLQDKCNYIKIFLSPDSGSSCKSCMIIVYSVCLWQYDISDPTLMDMTSNFFVLCNNMKVCLTLYPI